MSFLSPVKSATISPSRFLSLVETLLKLLVCSKCEVFLPSSAVTQVCSKCQQAWGAPVVFALADGFDLSPQLTETHRPLAPTGKQQLLAGYRLPLEVRAEQGLSKLLPDFPDYLLTDPTEILSASSLGRSVLKPLLVW